MDNTKNELELFTQSNKFDISNITKTYYAGIEQAFLYHLRIYQECAPRKQLIKSRTNDKSWHKLENNITKATVPSELRLCKVQQAVERILEI